MSVTIEEHPWKLYPKNSTIEKLIVGSFPPNKMTLPVGYKMTYLDGKEEHKKKETKKFDFFYGSIQNGFWDLFISSLKLNIGITDLEGLKNWLKENKWGVTDIVSKTTRQEDSPSDADLVIKEWNTEVIERVLQEHDIKKIYFTSTWVRDRFKRKKIINPKLYKSSNLFTLISPSGQAFRRLPNDALAELPMRANEDGPNYRKRYWEYVLSKN